MAINNGKQFINGQRVAVHAAALESVNATDYQPTGYL
jgi:NADP-dependent aldehyde dehydrogenase